MKSESLRLAFIRSQCDEYTLVAHSFSPEFERKMQALISSQGGIARLYNTAAKRAACIALAAVVALGTAACSIKPIREPIAEKIEQLVYDIRTALYGTAPQAAGLFPADAVKIVAKDYTDTAEREYIIESGEKIEAFIVLLSAAEFTPNTEERYSAEEKPYWSFAFYGADGGERARLVMLDDGSRQRGRAAVLTQDTQGLFYIDKSVYSKLLSFTNRRYYLHASRLARPSNDFCLAAEARALRGLDTARRAEAETCIRTAHYAAERLLLENVSLLKSGDSIYWQYVISGEAFKDKISGEEVQISEALAVTSQLERLCEIITDTDTLGRITESLRLWNRALEERDLQGLFTAHEYIHDLDYFAINYPTGYVYDPYADFQGLDDYFGHLED